MSKPYPFDDHFINVFNHNMSNYFIRVTSNHHDILLPLNALEKIESEKNHFFFFFFSFIVGRNWIVLTVSYWSQQVYLKSDISFQKKFEYVRVYVANDFL